MISTSVFHSLRKTIIKCSNMATPAAIQRLQLKKVQSDAIIENLRHQLDIIKKNAVSAACIAEEQKLRRENDILKKEINELKISLTEVEIKHGVKQVAMPSKTSSTATRQVVQSESKPSTSNTQEKPQQKKEKKQASKGEGNAKKAKGAGDAPARTIDASMLNMRIGKIVNVKKHPDADSLYVEEVDVGEETHRTIVSGLVKHVTLEQMQDRIAIFLLNLKPAKMRGVLSEGMIMCGSSPEQVEIIVPPAGSAIGSRVTVEGYAGEAEGQLNPKKKMFEQIQPDFRIDANGVATYKGNKWVVDSCPGDCTVPSMKNSGIK